MAKLTSSLAKVHEAGLKMPEFFTGESRVNMECIQQLILQKAKQKAKVKNGFLETIKFEDFEGVVGVL